MTRSLAFLAAMFAIVLGTLMPFAVLAASVPGQPLVICSAAGPQTINIGHDQDNAPGKAMSGVKCAACVMPLAAALPTPPAPIPAAPIRTVSAVAYAPVSISAPPPARAPPRPHSTAPPTA